MVDPASALLQDLSSSIDKKRRDALKALVAHDFQREGAPEALITVLGRTLREGGKRDVDLALEVVEKLGPKASAIALEVVSAFASLRGSPYGCEEALKAIGELPAEARPVLEELARARRSDVVEAAMNTLRAAFGVEVPVERVIAQLQEQLASKSYTARTDAIMAAGRYGRAAAALIPTLVARGSKVAKGTSRDARCELAFICDALTAIGCRPDDLPHPPSRLQAVEGQVPSERAKARGLLIGEITRKREHGRVGVSCLSCGVWDNKTGRLLFLVDDAALMAFVPGRAEVAVVRLELKSSATAGGTSRADYVWYFERYALPTGARLTSLEIGEEYTHGWPSWLDFRERRNGMSVTLEIADEDWPCKLMIRLGTGTEADATVDKKQTKEPVRARKAAKKRVRKAAAKQPRKAAKKRVRKAAAKQPRKAAKKRVKKAAAKEPRKAAKKRVRKAAAKQPRKAAKKRDLRR